jgi:hypothetical protein
MIENVPSAACSASGCTALCARKSDQGLACLALTKSSAMPFRMSVM